MEDNTESDQQFTPRKFSRRGILLSLPQRLKEATRDASDLGEKLFIPQDASQKEKEKARKYTRRGMVGSLVAAAAGVALGWGLNKITAKKSAPQTPSGPEPLYLRPTVKYKPPPPEKLPNEGLLDLILDLKPNSKDRRHAEEVYFNRIATILDIDNGFRTIFDPGLRASLLDKRYELRANKEAIKDQAEWAQKQSIHPEVMGICLDVYEKAKEIIDEKHLMNPGGMAMLILTETSNFTDIGKSLAMEQIRPKVLPHALDHLVELFKRIRADTGLNYKVEQLPGSIAGEGDQSGGAVGLQFMPSTGLWVYDMLKADGIKFNPMDLESSVLGAWRLIAENGYRRGSETTIKRALTGWNRALAQITRIYGAAESYWLAFLNKPNIEQSLAKAA